MDLIEIAANKVATAEELMEQPNTEIALDGTVRFE
jgi:hypothetical protein